MSKKYFGKTSLESLMKMIKEDLSKKADVLDITDNLTSEDPNKILSAAQGKVLDEKIKALDSNGDGIADNAAMLGGHTPDYFATAESVQEQVTDQKGQPDGLAPLGSNGKIDSEYLPSYVDDVIEGYYDAENNKFYEDEAKTTEVTGEKGKIYIDLITNQSYRWSGTEYIEISSPDMEEFTEEDIDSMWNSSVEEVVPPQPEVPIDISTLGITDATTNRVYDGTVQHPTINTGEHNLVEGTDYEIEVVGRTINGTDGRKASIYTENEYTVTGIGKYTGSVQLAFDVGRRPITIESVVIDADNPEDENYIPNIKEIKFGNTVDVDNISTFTATDDSSVVNGYKPSSFNNYFKLPDFYGTYNYVEVSKDIKFINFRYSALSNLLVKNNAELYDFEPTTIPAGTHIPCNEYTLVEPEIVINMIQKDFDYDGQVHKPNVEISYGDYILEEDTDYTMSISNNSAKPGSYTVVINGKGDFSSKINYEMYTMVIKNKELSFKSITVPSTVTGSTSDEKIEVPIEGIELDGVVEGEDVAFTMTGNSLYVKAHAPNKAAGTYNTVIIEENSVKPSILGADRNNYVLADVWWGEFPCNEYTVTIN